MAITAKVRAIPGGTEISLAGRIDESAARDIESAFAKLDGPVTVNFRQVERVNSWGASVLSRIFERAIVTHQLSFVECPEMVVDLFQMLDFARFGRIESLFVPYVCERCSREDRIVVRTSDLRGDTDISAPTAPCSCGGTLVADEDLGFMREHVRR